MRTEPVDGSRPARPASGARPAPPRGFRFDLNQCTGCNACELACSIENQLGWGRSWRHVVSFNERRLPALPAYHLSLACNHCENAPCLRACPALAIRRDDATGAVLIDSSKCMGCGYCSWACPYDAPRFDERARVMGKCTWCHPRLVEGRLPACVEQCPTGALGFGALEGTEAVPGFPVTDARPAIRFQTLREERLRPPESTWQLPADVLASFSQWRPAPERGITLRGEWPLLVFTLLASGLVGWMMATVGHVDRPDPRIFLGLTAMAMTVSSLHLGRQERAWRAVLNLRGSWLSREIAFFGGFAVALAVHLIAFPSRGAGLIAASLGLVALFCADRVYDVVRSSNGPRVHSADTLFTAVLVWSALHGSLPGLLATAGVKLFLYGMRWRHRLQEGAVPSGLGAWGLPALRVGLGIAAPVVLAIPGMGAAWAIPPIAAGEILDRIEFYGELEIPTPRRLLARAG